MTDESLYETTSYNNQVEELIAKKKARKKTFAARVKNSIQILKNACNMKR